MRNIVIDFSAMFNTSVGDDGAVRYVIEPSVERVIWESICLAKKGGFTLAFYLYLDILPESSFDIDECGIENKQVEEALAAIMPCSDLELFNNESADCFYVSTDEARCRDAKARGVLCADYHSQTELDAAQVDEAIHRWRNFPGPKRVILDIDGTLFDTHRSNPQEGAVPNPTLANLLNNLTDLTEQQTGIMTARTDYRKEIEYYKSKKEEQEKLIRLDTDEMITILGEIIDRYQRLGSPNAPSNMFFKFSRLKLILENLPSIGFNTEDFNVKFSSGGDEISMVQTLLDECTAWAIANSMQEAFAYCCNKLAKLIFNRESAIQVLEKVNAWYETHKNFANEFYAPAAIIGSYAEHLTTPGLLNEDNIVYVDFARTELTKVDWILKNNSACPESTLLVVADDSPSEIESYRRCETELGEKGYELMIVESYQPGFFSMKTIDALVQFLPQPTATTTFAPVAHCATFSATVMPQDQLKLTTASSEGSSTMVMSGA